MSIFGIHAAAMNEHILDMYGESLVYTQDGTPKTILMILDDPDEQLHNDDTGEITLKFRRAAVPQDTITGIATPAIGDQVTIGSEVWYVTEIIGVRSRLTDVRLRYDKPISKQHQEHVQRLPKG